MVFSHKVVVIGGGLAGVEASYYLASKGIQVYLYESKKIEKTPAQKSNNLAELVCTNSLKSVNPTSAHGLLKKEMHKLGSIVLKVASDCAVPAGDSLAVDRDKFSEGITSLIKSHPRIELIHEVAKNPEELLEKHQADFAIVSSGPLTLKPLEEWLVQTISNDDLYFYDAIAPVVDADSLDYDKLYFKDRHKEESESADYLNVPLSEMEYYNFVEELTNAEIVPAQNFEKEKFFEGCLPVDVMAKRGVDTLRFSCMKPIGLEHEGTRPFAVVQLRKENLLGSAFNMVGFQNRLTYKEQLRVFRMLPGFEKATFPHLGSVHRNTYVNASKLLNVDLSAKSNERIHFAGQIAGVEGYTESASMGLYVAYQVERKLRGKEVRSWPVETSIGALVNYLMTDQRAIPSNMNFGLVPQVILTKEQRKNKDRKKIKKEIIAKRAQQSLEHFLGSEGE